MGKFTDFILVWASSESLEDILRSCSVHESFFPGPPSSVRSRLSLNLWGIKIDFPSPYVCSEPWPLGLGGFVPGQLQKRESGEEKSFGLVFKNLVKSFKIYLFSDVVTHTEKKKKGGGGRGRRKKWKREKEKKEKRKKKSKRKESLFISGSWYFKNNVFFPPANLKQGI